MRSIASVSALLSIFLLAAEASSVHNDNVFTLQGHLTELPDTGQDWISLQDGTEFQPASSLEDWHRHLTSSFSNKRSNSNTKGSGSGYEHSFIDGSSRYYNDYAQAWRLLGFYIDCNAPFNNDNECYDEGGQNNNNNDESDEPACQRYLLWAAVSLKISVLLSLGSNIIVLYFMYLIYVLLFVLYYSMKYVIPTY